MERDESDHKQCPSEADDLPTGRPEAYRPWLLLLARLQIDSLFQGKFDPSDIVQQTLLEAHRCRDAYRGRAPQQYMAWLRGILHRVLGHELRRYCGTQARQIDREASLQAAWRESTRRLENWLHDQQPSPSEIAIESEQVRQLADALAQLPLDYQEVVVLRNLEGLTHEQIAVRMQRSVGAVRMLWVRALASLRKAVDGTPPPTSDG